MATPTTPKGLRTRQSITEAGRKVFARNGFVNARMSDVALEANVSMGGLYRYFGNKEDLFEAVIKDLHESLFEASAPVAHRFASEPYEALYEANRGYLAKYYEFRDVMRAFIEAAHVDPRFRDIWWTMRRRHVDRFLAAMERNHRSSGLRVREVELAGEALACMTEQSAYVWFAQEALGGGAVDVEEAARVVTDCWYRTLFADPSK